MRALALSFGLACLLLGAASAQRYVATTASDFPKIRYADSLVSANDRCIVSLAKLNPRMAPLYVNGVPIGFC